MTFKTLLDMFIDLGKSAIPLLAMIAFFIFVWGVARFIRASGSDTDLDEKKKLLVWGIVAMFVLVAIWGIIAFIRGEFGFGQDVKVPQLPITYNTINWL